MKVGSIYLPQLAAGSGQTTLVMRGEQDLLTKLTLGQIIKGRVLRVFESQRYLMSFYGRERVVDSTLPLALGELVHGRVVGLGERIEIQRLPLVEADAGAAQDQERPPLFADPTARAIEDVFARYRASLDAEGIKVLRLAARGGDSERAAMSGLVLAKLGLQITPEFVRALLEALGTRSGVFAPAEQALRAAAADSAQAGAGDAGAALLARALAMPEPGWRAAPRDADDMSRAGTSASGDDDAGGGRSASGSGLDLARWILNAQTGATVAHRVGTLPLLIDDELVELDVALFDQSQDEDDAPGALRHRRVVLSLATGTLGRVEVDAAFTGARVRLRVTAEDSETAAFLSRYARELEAALAALGWYADELRYEVREEPAETRPTHGALSAVVGTVVEHIISPGSVSRLM